MITRCRSPWCNVSTHEVWNVNSRLRKVSKPWFTWPKHDFWITFAFRWYRSMPVGHGKILMMHFSDIGVFFKCEISDLLFNLIVLITNKYTALYNTERCGKICGLKKIAWYIRCFAWRVQFKNICYFEISGYMHIDPAGNKTEYSPVEFLIFIGHHILDECGWDEIS